jgi:Xaa-Pro dipeptidase
VYLKWQELEAGVGQVIGAAKKIAMEYSPRNAIPYVSKVDGGTVELVRALGADVVSSGDLIQMFEATLDEDQWKSHLEAEKRVLAAHKLGFDMIADWIRSGKPLRETDVQAAMMTYFETNNIETDHPPIVGFGPNSGNPHYAPERGSDAAIAEGDFVLLDAWGKVRGPRSVYADYTRVAFAGSKVPAKQAKVFAVVAEARDAALTLVSERLAKGDELCGWEVDDATRGVIEKAGYGEYFIHRTGHNIAQDLHGNGTHIDNLETHDARRILPRTCFSIEPGIYLPEFGVRSEINVYIDAKGHVHVTGDPQQELPALL